jgi:hypothetical protein
MYDESHSRHILSHKLRTTANVRQWSTSSSQYPKEEHVAGRSFSAAANTRQWSASCGRPDSLEDEYVACKFWQKIRHWTGALFMVTKDNLHERMKTVDRVFNAWRITKRQKTPVTERDWRMYESQMVALEGELVDQDDGLQN